MGRPVPGDRRAALPALVAILVVALAAPAACVDAGPASPRPGPSAGEQIHRGLVFGLFARRDPRFIRSNLKEIRDLGANAVSVVIPWVTPDVRSTEILPREDMSPGDGPLRQTIREAHRLGMSVLLMPIVYVDHMEEGDWRGAIRPPDWDRWFRAYGRMILSYATMAEEEGAALLSVGSELCSTESRREDWLRLIGEVRKVYSGALTYSANWDHREEITFADALDYLGTNTYFELSRGPDPSVAELLRAWEPIVARVTAWAARAGKPLLLTEVGYPSRRGAASDPWDHTAPGAPDPEGQARAYRAFLEAWTGVPDLAGVYFYIWWGEGGSADTGYTPRGKPAEEVLRGWLQKSRPGDGS